MAATVIMAVKHRPPLLPILLFLILVERMFKILLTTRYIDPPPLSFLFDAGEGGGAQNIELLFSIPIGGRGQNIMIVA